MSTKSALTVQDLDAALSSESLPDDKNILALVWLGIKSIKRDTSDLRSDFDALSVRTKALEESDIAHDQEIKALRAEVQTVRAEMARMKITQRHHSHDLEDLKTRSMRDNIIIHFDDSADDFSYSEGEDCPALVLAFLNNVMGLTCDIHVQSAHRLGKAVEGKIPDMIARIPVTKQREAIFKAASCLQNTGHSINHQLPPSKSERRQFAYNDFKSLKSDPRNKARLNQDKLYVKNKLQTQFLAPVLPEVPALAADDDTLVKIAESRKKSDGGSTFKGYCAGVHSVQDVSAVRQQLVSHNSEVTNATHVIYAYRIQGPRGKIYENYDSDRDWSTGMELLKEMRKRDIIDAVCVATRMCSPNFVHIGRKRFSIINELCANAWQNLKKL